MGAACRVLQVGGEGAARGAKALVLANLSQGKVLVPLLMHRDDKGEGAITLYRSLIAVSASEATTLGRWAGTPMPDFVDEDSVVSRNAFWSWTDGKRDTQCMSVASDGLSTTKHSHRSDYSAGETPPDRSLRSQLN